MDRLVQRLELGRPLTGTLPLSRATDAERRALRELLGTARITGATVSVNLDALARVLDDAGIAPDLATAVQELRGPIVPRAAVEAAEEAARYEGWDAALRSVHAAEPWFEDWLEQLSGSVLTRLIRTSSLLLLTQAVAVLDMLPAQSLPLPVLAERATGDTKALIAGEPLSRLVLRALALRAQTPVPRSREGERKLWATAGVVSDDLASQVLVLNLRTQGGNTVSSWLDDAAAAGLPFRLTLHQLSTHPVRPSIGEVFVCENPAILRAAAMTPSGSPLVCTEGIPSAACHLLLEGAVAAGATLRWRADFDWTGLRIVGAAISRHGAHPWRMSAADYTEALRKGDSEPLRGSPSPAPWDETLPTLMHQSAQAVMEERLLPTLLNDLSAGLTGRARPAVPRATYSSTIVSNSMPGRRFST